MTKKLKVKIKDKSKKDAILYVRIRRENKSMVEVLAKEMGISASQFLDHILDELRTQNDLII